MVRHVHYDFKMTIADILLQIDQNGSLGTGALDAVFLVHGGSRSDFSDGFAKDVAQRYLQGAWDYDVADGAINALAEWMPLENFSSFSWAIYRAFDEGEYLHQGQEAGTNEALYTRPMLRRAMCDFFPSEAC